MLPLYTSNQVRSNKTLLLPKKPIALTSLCSGCCGVGGQRVDLLGLSVADVYSQVVHSVWSEPSEPVLAAGGPAGVGPWTCGRVSHLVRGQELKQLTPVGRQPPEQLQTCRVCRRILHSKLQHLRESRLLIVETTWD